MPRHADADQWLAYWQKQAEATDLHPYREWTFRPPEGAGEPTTLHVALIRHQGGTMAICPQLKLASEDADHLTAQFQLTDKIKAQIAPPDGTRIIETSLPAFVMTWGEKATPFTRPSDATTAPTDQVPPEAQASAADAPEAVAGTPDPQAVHAPPEDAELSDALAGDDAPQQDTLDLFGQELQS